MERFLVSASTGAMGSLLGKLGTILSDEYKLLKDVHDDIKFLKDELEAMHAFLLVMADVENPDQQAKLRVDAVRELSYEIEDNIDKFMLLVGHGSSSKSDGFQNVFSKSMKKIADIKTRHKIAKDVKDIMSQVKVISERYSRYMIDGSSRTKNEKIDPRIIAIYKDTSELVGIHGPRDELLKWLSNKEGESESRTKVVSIVGYGGLGKTTLAKQVYDKHGANYECRAFVSISRSPDMNKILSSVLSQLRNCDYAHAGDAQLIIEQIRNFLKDKRYCIVIDDVWDVETWLALDCALVTNGCGSVIITTTRIHDVAKSCCSSEGDFVYKIQPLCVADSKKLFFKRIFGCEENCPSNLKQASEDILKKCGGLPLAINAISSLLATGKTKEEWERVRSSIGFAQGQSSAIDAMSYILSLSYFDLPLCLRSCLLYLTMYPEDYKINMEQLVYRWIYEGFIHSEDGEDLVELGDRYLYELINRSLIQPVDTGYYVEASFCRVHDTILDFLVYRSTEENFCTFLSSPSNPHRRVRRLSLIGNEDVESVEQLDLSHARSFGAFGRSRTYLPILVTSNALHVLDISDCRRLGNQCVKDIGRLLQLRYLDISWTDISELPKQIGDLQYLETLDVRCTRIAELPESANRLKRLTRLFGSVTTKLPDEIGNMRNLQELDFSVFVQSLKFLEDLGKLTNLRKLGINWNSNNEPDKGSYKKQKLVSSVCKLDKCKLHTLFIELHLTENDATFMMHSFPALSSIRAIDIQSGKLSWVTKWLALLVNLKNLYIESSAVEQQDVNMVGSLPNLLKFVLEECYSDNLGPIVISGGFQQLQVLGFNPHDMALMFEVGAVPNLKNLSHYIHPRGFKFAHGSAGGFDIGIHHLSNLTQVEVRVFCVGAWAADVEAAEGAFRSMAEAHPSQPPIEFTRINIDRMLKDDE
ncbi:hypothetical protein QYE76_001864 [Lolium multiflorum]|uniref:Uncharacterized protein n=1 Tax=Lolium multiflorum TaxID=4521 RepID=A0AAD8RM54_LOLMU|nr:hypothetical protein QYE76_001864 [Lolium multiflorum]